MAGKTTAREVAEAAALLNQQATGRNLDRTVEIELTNENCADGDVQVYVDRLSRKADGDRIKVVDHRRSTRIDR